MKYCVTKTLNPNKGFSCVFRQWKAKSHCSHMHGYDLIFEVTFEADILDDIGWVVDFGGLDYLKSRIEFFFDHMTIVADDDPYKDEICALQGLGILDATVLPAVGCEAFACWLAVEATDQLEMLGILDRVRVHSATVREHGANAATYKPDHEKQPTR